MKFCGNCGAQLDDSAMFCNVCGNEADNSNYVVQSTNTDYNTNDTSRNIFESYKLFWENYVNFSGRTNRKDFWQTLSVNFIISFALNLPLQMIEETTTFKSIIAFITLLFSAAIFIPNLSLGIRRIRDAGYNWQMIFIALLPIIGWIILIVIYCKDSVPEQNGSEYYGNTQQY